MQRTDSLEKEILVLGKIEGKRRRKQHKMRWLDIITDSIDTNLSKFQETVEDREAWRAAVRGVTKSCTWLSNWKTTTNLSSQFNSGSQRVMAMRQVRMLLSKGLPWTTVPRVGDWALSAVQGVVLCTLSPGRAAAISLQDSGSQTCLAQDCLSGIILARSWQSYHNGLKQLSLNFRIPWISKILKWI